MESCLPLIDRMLAIHRETRRGDEDRAVHFEVLEVRAGEHK